MNRGHVLVPGDAHVERALREIGSIEGTRVATVSAFARDAAETLAGERGVASREASRLAAGAAIDLLAEAGHVRAPNDATARARFADAVDRSLGTLRRAGAAPDTLLDSGTRGGEMLALVMREVDAALAGAKLWDGRELGAIVAARLAKGDDLDAAELGDAIELRGLVAIDGDARAMLEALHAAARRRGGSGVKIELPRFADDEEDSMAVVAEPLERRWAGLADAPEIVWREVRGPTTEARSVVTARDAEGEARAAVAAILDALERGAAPERIAILTPDLDDARLEPLRAALADAGVPFREPRGRPASISAEGRVTNALLALAAGPVLRDDILEVLRTPSIHSGAWMDREGELDAAKRAASLAHRLRAVPVSVDRTGRWLVEGLARAVDDRPDERWMPHALTKLVDTSRFLANATTRRGVADRLASILETLRLGKPSRRPLAAALREETENGRGAALGALGGATRAAQAVEAALLAWRDGATALGIGEAPIDAARAAAEIGALLGNAGTAPRGAAASAASVRLVRARDLTRCEGTLDLVVVIGLEEGAFDASDADDGLVDERLRRALSVPVRPPPQAEVSATRRAELAWALAAATRVVFTHATGTDVEPAAPHRLVRAAISAGAPARREPLARVARSASIVDAHGAELSGLARGERAARDIAARVDVERARTAFFMDPGADAARFTGRFATNDAERAHLVACLGGSTPEAPIAVTAIEALAECPFRGFARRVMRLRRREDLGEVASPMERGTLVHRALHAAFDAILATSGGVDVAMAAARTAAERALIVGTAMAPLRAETIARAIDEALAVVEAALDSDDPVRFAFGERAFGPKHPPPWQALALPCAPAVFVEGQIDRIDRSADGLRARVIDYKTGSKKPTIDEHGKTRFQLAVYATVVEERLGAAAVEASYVIVRPRGVVEEHPKKAEARAGLVAGRAEALASAARVVISAWEGAGPPRPENGATCARCEARDVCRRPAVVPEADDPST